MKRLALLMTLWLCASAAQATVIYRFSFSNSVGNADGPVSGLLALDFLSSSQGSGSGAARPVTDIEVPKLVPALSEAAALFDWLDMVFNKVVVEFGVVTEFQLAVGVDPDGPLLCMNSGDSFRFPDPVQFVCEHGMNYFGTGRVHVSNVDSLAAVTFAPVAEPTGAALLIAGILPLLTTLRRRDAVGLSG